MKEKLEGCPVYTRPIDGASVPLHKLVEMHRIAKDFDLPIQNTILLDDLPETCDLLQKNNVPVIRVEKAQGITQREYHALNKFISSTTF